MGKHRVLYSATSLKYYQKFRHDKKSTDVTFTSKHHGFKQFT